MTGRQPGRWWSRILKLVGVARPPVRTRPYQTHVEYVRERKRWQDPKPGRPRRRLGDDVQSGDFDAP